MFTKTDDIDECLAPIALVDPEALDKAIDPEIKSLKALYGKLQAFVALRANEDSALRDFMEESGINDWIGEGFEVFQEYFRSAETDTSISLARIYDLAVSCFEQKRFDDAITLFTVISTLGVHRAPVLSALAACACHQMRYQHGFDLAEQSLVYEDRHPRTHLIAGYCALKVKDLKNAKHYLALTSRLARNDPRFRKEKRSAQRELLMMQFS